MQALWIVPPAVLVLGAVTAIAYLRSIDGAMEEIRTQLHRMVEVRASVEELRAETARTRASLESLDQR
jgi:hypothetical protein